MSVFNLETQNAALDNKIVAGLERLSQVFRKLLWGKAKDLNLSPIQIQLLIFVRYHTEDKSTVSYLAKEFNLTKPTISDAIKSLEQKKLIKKNTNTIDGRGYFIQLTPIGKKVVSETENFVHPLTLIISEAAESEKIVLWNNIVNMIVDLNKLGVISVQRTCFNCTHYSGIDKGHFCNLLSQKLQQVDIRIDCNEFELINSSK